jgi:integrase
VGARPPRAWPRWLDNQTLSLRPTATEPLGTVTSFPRQALAASLAYAATHDLETTAERLGHTPTRMVDTIYVKLHQDADRRVADAIDELVRALIVHETDH